MQKSELIALAMAAAAVYLIFSARPKTKVTAADGPIQPRYLSDTSTAQQYALYGAGRL